VTVEMETNENEVTKQLKNIYNIATFFLTF